MCGIYGVAKSPTPYTKKQLEVVKKVLREIAIDSETRGSHSSGIARVGSSTRIHKSLLPSSKFVDTKEYNESVKSLKDDSFILLGHTRFATEGAIIKSNAHPFRVGDVVGAHNGCVYNIKEMQTKLDKQCPVDSQLIFKAINDNENIQDAVKNFDSDFALSFVKNNPMVLYLCRESNRPLHVAYIPSLKTLFYASESDFIENALMMYNIQAEVFSLNKNTLYVFDVSKFTDEKINVDKVPFDYESRVYQYQTLQPNYTKDSWKPIVSPSSTFDDEAEFLASIYGGNSSEWFFDETEQEWYHICPESGQIMSEEQIATEQYYNNAKWESIGNENK
tara:strand:- start:19351 stop:20352 length:1002 start_codon:yes stop_codon:yes gene_type:complete